MKKAEYKRALKTALAAARAAGALMRKNLDAVKKVNLRATHDIKLDLDVRCQKLIEGQLARAFPQVSFLGEEGKSGAQDAAARWVVDPIDGTVNYAYGIPHACVSIALQEKLSTPAANSRAAMSKAQRRHSIPADGYATVIGVVFDPFTDELWTATRGGKAFLNGRPISVSGNSTLN